MLQLMESSHFGKLYVRCKGLYHVCLANKVLMKVFHALSIWNLLLMKNVMRWGWQRRTRNNPRWKLNTNIHLRIRQVVKEAFEQHLLKNNKVIPPKSDICFIFSLGSKGLVCVLDNLISKWNGSEGKNGFIIFGSHIVRTRVVQILP